MSADTFISDLVNSGETDVKMPKFTVIVCKKRISARFFMADKGGYLSNPTPGTTISASVTRMYEDESWSNFYLVSQSVRQGTVGPTHYVVIENESTSEGKTIPVQMLQKITYKLTHLYFNWPGTIRVPAPVQYAHKLAFLAGQHLHRDLRYDHQLADLLFFL
ncbi:piwi-like protein 1 [Branchiostoma floridae]|uniref:Piwi-like protein 1 n=1 Tax=Branchiostoma floridae TaxID=7739 RepID=A0A9J7MZP0_BRAFL|nr:piwi-like protein 1 [Branchiostoma floridae]